MPTYLHRSLCFRAWDTQGESIFVCENDWILDQSYISIEISPSNLRWEIGVYPHAGWRWWNTTMTMTAIFGLLLATSFALLTYRTGTQIMQTSKELMQDQLTGTLNKRAFSRVLSGEISLHNTSGGNFVLAIVDIDDFKRLNDDCGHLAGDRALVMLAEHIKANLRSYDVVARFGGDEFVLVLRHLGPKDSSHKIIQTIFERIMTTALPYENDHEAMHISMGAAFWPEDAVEAEDLFAVADKHLYRAKSLRKSRLCFADDEKISKT